MKHILPALVCLLLSTAAAAQEIAGVRFQLAAPSIVAANADVDLRLTIQVLADVELPARFLSGADLTVRVEGEARDAIVDTGRGAAVALTKGTVIERQLRMPARRFVGDAVIDEVALVAVGWKDLIGVDCTFKVAPDTADVKLDELDLARTEVMLITNYGDIQLAFRPDKAPVHVENFVKLCLQGFYDGTRFHRVIRNFMAQGGCPLTKNERLRDQWGTGDAGYELDLEPSDLRHLRGTLSMAHSPTGPDTASSQFFLVHKDSPHLDSQYSAFGNVIRGMDTLDRICSVPVTDGARYRPVEQVVLQAAVVLPKKKR